MNFIDTIFKYLNISPNEEWRANNGKRYLLKYNGTLHEVVVNKRIFCSTKERRKVDENEYMKFLRGEIKPAWKPEKGQTFYVPDILNKSFIKHTWAGNDRDNQWYERGLVFETGKEAEERALSIIKAAKNKI